MKPIVSFPNVITTDPDYVYGRLKDDTGANDGTPVGENEFNDMFQFFARLMVDAGIAANNIPDNNANGFQLVNALYARINTLSTAVISTAYVWAAIPLNILSVTGGGSAVITTYIYARRVVLGGKTLLCKIRFEATITGTVDSILFGNMLNGATWSNPDFCTVSGLFASNYPAPFGGDVQVVARLGNLATQVILYRFDGSAFDPGIHLFNVEISGELA